MSPALRGLTVSILFVGAGLAVGAERSSDEDAIGPPTGRIELDPPVYRLDLPMVEAHPADSESVRDFYDFNLGIGVVVLHDREEGRVESAAVRKGTIHVEEDRRTRLGVLIEAHRMFRISEDDDRFGHGPFVGLIAGEESVVDALAFGWMAGMRRGASSQSFNLMLGAFFDPDARTLADDFQEGDHFKTDGQVQYQEEPMWGWLLGASFGF